MDNPKKNETLAVKRFGYIISTFFLILANISLVNLWALTPILFIVTMYLLTGALWGPALIRPIYNLFGKYIIKPSEGSEVNKDIFSDN